MPEKTLVDIDLRIAKLRDQMAKGQANLEMMAELDRLIEQRWSLINKMVAAASRQTPPPDKPADKK